MPNNRMLDLVGRVVRKEPDILAAENAVYRRLTDDADLMHEWGEPLLRRGIREMIHACRHQRRTEAKANAMPHRLARGADVLADLAAIQMASILDTWLVGNKRLGECTRVELLAEAENIGAQIGGLSRNRKYFKLIADRLDYDDTRVADRLNGEQAAALWASVCGADAKQLVLEDAAG